MTLKEYYQKLMKHDWTHDYSDDFYAWKAGVEAHNKLKELSSLSAQHLQLWNSFNAYMYNKGDLPTLTQE